MQFSSLPDTYFIYRWKNDQRLGFRDGSDEQDCRLLVLKSGYNMKIPPITTDERRNIIPVPVRISIILMKIVRIEEVDHKIEFQFGIVLEWPEIRALFHNLKFKSSLNALTDDEILQLWLPYVIYDNTDMKEVVQLDDGTKTTVTVSREGGFTRSGLEVADEIEVFEGGENKLTMNQTYSKKFQCEYQLHRYPFDIQVRRLLPQPSTLIVSGLLYPAQCPAFGYRDDEAFTRPGESSFISKHPHSFAILLVTWRPEGKIS